MGLDNIPAVYPCRLHQTAVLDNDGRIDCQETIKQNRCPYHTIKNSDPFIKDVGGVLGMFGTECWYRGKYGNYLLDKMRNWNDAFSEEMGDGSFYGDIQETDENQGGISAEECLRMSEIMARYLESWIAFVKNTHEYATEEDKQRGINDWIYATWWLKFVGENAEGSGVWY